MDMIHYLASLTLEDENEELWSTAWGDTDKGLIRWLQAKHMSRWIQKLTPEENAAFLARGQEVPAINASVDLEPDAPIPTRSVLKGIFPEVVDDEATLPSTPRPRVRQIHPEDLPEDWIPPPAWLTWYRKRHAESRRLEQEEVGMKE
ncbi:uncharacterized protein FTOL_13954 [Fusarium torulosum]|uniref:Uncharacterized protein n=1 Tax=Fusarium torulosum TaxID=33205 RepID=A0AAE8SQQ4_9HYPO|nr:uncharacterized protein FTOL_13954 [Fusarium torulosum]